MHRSRLCSFVIDCCAEDIDAAAGFWSAALGRAVAPADPDDPLYRRLESSDVEPILLVQKVEHPSRIHLDIEADDLDAEVKRLEALGARRVAFVKRWWVLEAPTGQRFCVVRPQRGPLAERANEWPRAPAALLGGRIVRSGGTRDGDFASADDAAVFDKLARTLPASSIRCRESREELGSERLSRSSALQSGLNAKEGRSFAGSVSSTGSKCASA